MNQEPHLPEKPPQHLAKWISKFVMPIPVHIIIIMHITRESSKYFLTMPVVARTFLDEIRIPLYHMIITD